MKKLEDIEKKNPYKVPDDYFEKLSHEIIEGVKQPEKLHLNFKWAKLSGVAAVISVVLFLSVLYFVNQSKIQTKPQFVENTVIENFVDENSIINEIVEDTTIFIQDKNRQSNTEADEEDIDYVAESIDYRSILAEL